MLRSLSLSVDLEAAGNFQVPPPSSPSLLLFSPVLPPSACKQTDADRTPPRPRAEVRGRGAGFRAAPLRRHVRPRRRRRSRVLRRYLRTAARGQRCAHPPRFPPPFNILIAPLSCLPLFVLLCVCVLFFSVCAL
eukprot:3136496-Rhodomonas_salina.8